mgnify:CR=1 FL=1
MKAFTTRSPPLRVAEWLRQPDPDPLAKLGIKRGKARIVTALEVALLQLTLRAVARLARRGEVVGIVGPAEAERQHVVEVCGYRDAVMVAAISA